MPIWTPHAIADIQHTWDFIAADNEPAADRTIATIIAAGERLDELPHLGRKGSEPGTRELVVSRTAFKLIYRFADTGTVEILRVLHGARNWPSQG